MPSSPDRSQSSASQRLLSRLAAPFSAKSRNIPEFHVQAEDPHRQYSPGDAVRGSVIVKIVKPVRVTHIVVCLHGFAQVYKTPNAPPADGFRAIHSLVGKGRGKKAGEYFGNGFATLFQDEIVVCGDGRLADGSYKFEFEMALPDGDLPSSIDFERGTICYMLTATMTRPTTMNPLTFHDQKIYLVERLDIAPLLPPHPRTITLEPIHRKSRARSRAKKRSSPTENADSLSTRRSAQSSTVSSPLEHGLQRTLSASELSLDSRLSSNGTQSASGSAVCSTFTRDSAKTSTTTLHDRIVTASIESLVGGCLRGDSIPVKILVNHTKHIKSLHGVIVTLYRQAKVDMHPDIPLGPISEGEKKRYEDYYPKSITGLGGLSLSGAGSSHVFRKDLAQVFMPLMVDPRTLTAEINARVRVPEEAFPTISTVPGCMISFKYYVEVVLDIQGKLNADKFVYQASNPDVLANQYLDTIETDGCDRGQRQLFGAGIIDTAPIRRDKSAVTCVMEVIVGTHDSERRRAKGKGKADPGPIGEVDDTSNTGQEILQGDANVQHRVDEFPVHGDAQTGDGNEYYGDEYYGQGTYDYTNYYNSADTGFFDHQGLGYEEFIPPPPPEPEENLSEKDQLRQAEARLLPSQPPGAEDPAPDMAVPLVPTFNDVYEDSEVHSAPAVQEPAYGLGGPSHIYPAPYLPAPSSAAPGIPSYTDPLAMPSDDDKHELRSRELQRGASAPPAAGPDEETGSAGVDHEPTAPVLTDGDELYFVDDATVMGLPRYER